MLSAGSCSDAESRKPPARKLPTSRSSINMLFLSSSTKCNGGSTRLKRRPGLVDRPRRGRDRAGSPILSHGRSLQGGCSSIPEAGSSSGSSIGLLRPVVGSTSGAGNSSGAGACSKSCGKDPSGNTSNGSTCWVAVGGDGGASAVVSSGSCAKEFSAGGITTSVIRSFTAASCAACTQPAAGPAEDVSRKHKSCSSSRRCRTVDWQALYSSDAAPDVACRIRP